MSKMESEKSYPTRGPAQDEKDFIVSLKGRWLPLVFTISWAEKLLTRTGRVLWHNTQPEHRVAVPHLSLSLLGTPLLLTTNYRTLHIAGHLSTHSFFCPRP